MFNRQSLTAPDAYHHYTNCDMCVRFQPLIPVFPVLITIKLYYVRAGSTVNPSLLPVPITITHVRAGSTVNPSVLPVHITITQIRLCACRFNR